MEFGYGDKVILFDDNPLVYNDWCDVEEKYQIRLNTVYKVIGHEIDEAEEILYQLQDIETNVICDVMVNEWEIEKTECNA